MNIRKLTDYSAMYAELDQLMTEAMPQVELYFEIGRAVSTRVEKGAAVAASEYLQAAYHKKGHDVSRVLFCGFRRPDVLSFFSVWFWSARVFLCLQFQLEALTDIVRHSFHRNFQRGGQFAM